MRHNARRRPTASPGAQRLPPTVRTLAATLLLGAVLLTGLTGLAGPAAPPASAATTPAPDPTPCAPVALFAVPGTTETSAAADPGTPVGLLAGLTAPLTARWGDRLHVEYLAYPATIDGPPYLLSEARGISALTRVTTAYATRCPQSRILLVGYSQGADVASDLVHRAARGTVDLAPERIAGAVLLGNPRRDPAGTNLVPAPGHGILGPRPTRELAGYGARVQEVCAVSDPVCATESLDLSRLRDGLASGAHRSYATLPVGPDRRPLFAVLGGTIDRLVAASTSAPS